MGLKEKQPEQNVRIVSKRKAPQEGGQASEGDSFMLCSELCSPDVQSEPADWRPPETWKFGNIDCVNCLTL